MGDEAVKAYKAQVKARWKNAATGEEIEVNAGDVLTFEEGDFGQGALSSLEDVMARGLFIEWDPSHIGDITRMSRDEMLNFLRGLGKDEYNEENLAHNTPRNELIPLVESEIGVE